MIAVCIMFL